MTAVSLRARLDAGEKVPVSIDRLRAALENVPHIGIHYRLKEMVQQGILEEKIGSSLGSIRYFYKGRPIKIHTEYFGPSTWHVGDEAEITFTEPHDVVIDKKTKLILCMARTGTLPERRRDDQQLQPLIQRVISRPAPVKT